MGLSLLDEQGREEKDETGRPEKLAVKRFISIGEHEEILPTFANLPRYYCFLTFKKFQYWFLVVNVFLLSCVFE